MNNGFLFGSKDDLDQAYLAAELEALDCLANEHKLIKRENRIQRYQIKLLISKTEAIAKYSLTYLGRGIWQIKFYVWATKERQLRELIEKHQPHARYKIRIEVVKRKRQTS